MHIKWHTNDKIQAFFLYSPHTKNKNMSQEINHKICLDIVPWRQSNKKATHL